MSDEYDYKLPEDDDCWHLDEPHKVTVRLKSNKTSSAASIAEKGETSYERVGINARNAWKLGKRGENIKVVIFDTGVDYKHPSLESNIEPVLPLAADFDHSFAPEGRRFPQGRIDNMFHAHGTACAGLIGAVNPDSSVKGCRVVGVAPKAWLLPIRISTNFHTECLINALRYAAENGDVILMARPMPDTDNNLTEEIRKIASEIPFVCAAGNNGRGALVNPACLEETIAVGACNDRGYRSSYSQFGKNLDLVAPSNDQPVNHRTLTRFDHHMVDLHNREKEELDARLSGKSIQPFHSLGLGLMSAEAQTEDKRGFLKMGLLSIATTDCRGDFGYNFDPAGDYCKATGDFGFGGTSAAAAQIAGVIALMLSASPRLKGNPVEIRRILRAASSHEHLKCELQNLNSSSESNDGNHSLEFGFGLINSDLAVRKAMEQPRVNA